MRALAPGPASPAGSQRHQRRFADPWEFVRYATEQNLGLDFTSPPQRFAAPDNHPPRPAP